MKVERIFKQKTEGDPTEKIVISIIIGSLLGIIGAHFLFVGSAMSLIVWGIVGLAIGAWSDKRASIINGAAYGFALSFVFMLAGYTGTASLLSRLPFFALLGLFGYLCGFILGLLGFLLKMGIRSLQTRTLPNIKDWPSSSTRLALRDICERLATH